MADPETNETALAATDGNSDSTQLDEDLMSACEAGDLETAQKLLLQRADPSYQEPTERKSCLMAAAESGNVDLVNALLENGAVWHAQDINGYTAGEYGRGAVLQALLNFAVRAELILGVISSRERAQEGAPVNANYLESKLEYVATATDNNGTNAAADNPDVLVDAEGEGVMMEWERELMKRHAEVICPLPGEGRLLNIGFGLGIIDNYLQERKPESHTIIEAHPDVYKRMIDLGWDKKPGVNVVFGRWQDVIMDLGPFDGIFFDTYGEYYEDMREFHSHLPRLLNPTGGIYSFFNGLAPDNLFFHLVYGEIARLELEALGMSVEYEAVPITVAQEDRSWEGVKNRYWYLPFYFLPTCIMQSKQGQNSLETIEEEEK